MPVAGGPVEPHEQAESEASDKLILFVIALVIFHIGAFVSFPCPNLQPLLSYTSVCLCC